MNMNKLRLILLALLIFNITASSFAAASPPPTEGFDTPGGDRSSGQSSAQGGTQPSQEQLRQLQQSTPAGIWDQGEFNRIMRDLRFGNDWEKSTAALRFGRAKETRAVPALIDSLRDNKPKVMASIAEALGLIKDKRAVKPLVSWLKRLRTTIINKAYSKMSVFIIATIKALGEIGDKDATFAVCYGLEGQYRRIREATLTALLNIKDNRAIRKLQIAYYHEKIYIIKKRIALVIKKLGGRLMIF
jgi:hypothetical protein